MSDSSDRSLRAAIEAVEEPLLGRTLGELGLLESVSGKRFGADSVTVRIPVPNHPALRTLDQSIKDAADGRRLTVEFQTMDDAGRHELMERLRSEAGPGVGEPGNRTRVVAVSSGKGGVGKSSVSTNLAVTLAGQGNRVGIIDGDIWGFSIPRMFGVDHPPVIIDESIIPPRAFGVQVMSMDYFVPDDKAVIWRGPMLHKAIEQFLTDVFWDAPDYLIVDMPPGTGDIAISMAQFLPRAQVLLVTTPQPTAQRVARRAALMAAQVDQEVVGVVENMAWFTGDDGKRYELFGSGGGAALAEELGVPLMAHIPLLPAMREGADVGRPVSVAAPGSEAAESFETLAKAVEEARPRIRTHPDLVIR
ncbi:MAG TPA: Mrp/NBP35 family ATP-binding protein [Acidimicrobiia bacterium]|nr:Mrp/NBP35 family ATP-binding protein [Acidimicrobiia bacterium]